jgi:hypothetical protein
MTAGETVDAGGPSDVGCPGNREHRPRIEDAAPREERSDRDDGVGRDRWKDVFESGEYGD